MRRVVGVLIPMAALAGIVYGTAFIVLSDQPFMFRWVILVGGVVTGLGLIWVMVDTVT